MFTFRQSQNGNLLVKTPSKPLSISLNETRTCTLRLSGRCFENVIQWQGDYLKITFTPSNTFSRLEFGLGILSGLSITNQIYN